jgi:hypothetical protein
MKRKVLVSAKVMVIVTKQNARCDIEREREFNISNKNKPGSVARRIMLI